MNPFVPTVPTFAVRETASLGIMGAPRVPPLCQETQSLGQKMLELGFESSKFDFESSKFPRRFDGEGIALGLRLSNVAMLIVSLLTRAKHR